MKAKSQLSLIDAPWTGTKDLIKIKIKGIITNNKVISINGIIKISLFLLLIELEKFLNL
jgi:hypothetical protein